jgi:hypothetical protein
VQFLCREEKESVNADSEKMEQFRHRRREEAEKVLRKSTCFVS